MVGIPRTSTKDMLAEAADITSSLARKIVSPKTNLDDLKLISESLRDIASSIDHVRSIESLKHSM